MKKGTPFLCIGLLFVAAALCLTCYNLWDSRRAGRAAEAVLEQLTVKISAAPAVTYPYAYAKLTAGTASLIPRPGETVIPENTDILLPEEELPEVSPDRILYPDYMLNPNMPMPETEIDGLPYIGVLELPTLGNTFPIVSEWSYPNLKIAPCRYVGSVYQNNMVIAAHNYWMLFGGLPNLKIGDPVTFTDADGNLFTYAVAEIEILQPTAIEAMNESGYPLTLFTCTTSGRTRFTVRCERTS